MLQKLKETMIASGVISALLPKAGGTMTGALTLSGAPSADLHAATKKYVDDSIGLSYATGSWTPTLGSNSGLSGTWSTYTGRYTKIGRLVFLELGITGTSMNFGSAAAYAQINGLPFAPAVPAVGSFMNSGGTGTNGDVLTAGNGSDTYIYLMNPRTTAAATGFRASMVYTAAS